MLLSKEGPYYTHPFGSMGPTVESARQSPFFQWFHMEEVDRRPEEPGEELRFRPSGDKFHDLCYLDILTAPQGELVRMELAVQRAFIDGRDGIFAQDLVKSFLLGVLPDACQEVLKDFVGEMNTPNGIGRTPGFVAFRGQEKAWRTQTGWTRLTLANLPLTEEPPLLIVQVYPNPKAPNSVLVKDPAAGHKTDRSANDAINEW